jgi:hypothetical protein
MLFYYYWNKGDKMKLDLIEIARELREQGIDSDKIDSDKATNEVIFLLSSKYDLFNELYNTLRQLEEIAINQGE